MTDPPSADDLPLVSIVTPSFQQGRFLADAIDSVLAQDYPRLELWVIDAGSRDQTLDVLRRYGDRIHWLSEPDDGQSDAINKGFRLSSGSILAWLNADDVLAPGAVRRAVAAFQANPDLGLVYGHGEIIDESGRVVGPFAGIEPHTLWRLLHVLDYVLQPATFFSADAVARAGELDRDLHYCMDWDLWIRLAAVADVEMVDEVLGRSREYGDTKTATGGWRRIAELSRMVASHTGRRWTPGIRMYALETLRQMLHHRLPMLSDTADAWINSRLRAIQTDLAAYPDDWLGPRGRVVVPRRWGGLELMLEAHRLPADRPMIVTISVDGTAIEELHFTALGRSTRRLMLPPGTSPLVTLAIDSDYDFEAPPDVRRLAIYCPSVEPWRPQATIKG